MAHSERWNSAYYIIEHTPDQKVAITEYIVNNDIGEGIVLHSVQ